MNIAEFYSSAHLGYAFDDEEHSGQDIDKWPAGTEIPALRGGTFAGKGFDLRYGNWAAVEISPTWFLGYAHMQGPSPLLEGTVPAGKTVGRVGSTGGFAQGTHLHLYLGRTPHPAGRPKSNPLGTITAALNVQILTEGNNDMRLIRNVDGTITTVGETTYQHHSLASYPVDARLYGTPLQMATAAEFAQAVANTQIRKAYLLAGISGAGAATVDVAAIAAKVETQLADDFTRLAAGTAALNAAIQAGQFGPTLAQIDAADDDEHAALRKAIVDGLGDIELSSDVLRDIAKAVRAEIIAPSS